ncbi:MAG: exo-alpha-sialidase [Acidobacteriaceae bacterium]|nr:exo-alpha-sialidase [Acidobacteriaceae bacterium]
MTTYLAIRAVAIATVLFITLSCQRPTTHLRVERIDVPVPVGSMVPQMNAAANGAVLLSWLEPRRDKGYRFRAALRRGSHWDNTTTVHDSPDIMMFSADLPGVAQLPGGSLLAYWERADRRDKDDPYATAIQLSRSVDNGRTWMSLPSPHGDGASGEHSFVSAFSSGPELGLVWLDAQKQHHVHTLPSGGRPTNDEWLGAIGLRYASFRPDGQQVADTFIDPITCECCPTSAAVSARGPVVVYRNRVAPPGVRPQDIRPEAATVRDIYLARLEEGHWTEPRRVYPDNWVFNGCPDNGPAVDAAGKRVAVAWWTGASNQPHVSVAFSNDAGDTFGTPIRVSRKAAEGQVTLALVGDSQAAIVGWLEGQETWVRFVSADGQLGTATSLGPAPHHARLPKWVSGRDGVLAVWSQQRDGKRSVQMARLTP